MKYFIIPDKIELVNPGTKKVVTEITFADHARNQWLTDQRWYQPITRLKRLLIVQDVLEKPAKTEVFLEDADWAILEDIITAPIVTNLAPNPMLQVQLQPFNDVISNASSETHDARRKREAADVEQAVKDRLAKVGAVDA